MKGDLIPDALIRSWRSWPSHAIARARCWARSGPNFGCADLSKKTKEFTAQSILSEYGNTRVDCKNSWDNFILVSVDKHGDDCKLKEGQNLSPSDLLKAHRQKWEEDREEEFSKCVEMMMVGLKDGDVCVSYVPKDKGSLIRKLRETFPFIEFYAPRRKLFRNTLVIRLEAFELLE